MENAITVQGRGNYNSVIVSLMEAFGYQLPAIGYRKDINAYGFSGS